MLSQFSNLEGLFGCYLPELLDQVLEILRMKHYAYRTEQAYIDWIKRYILFHKKRHPKDISADEEQAFLTRLANERRITVFTRNQALSAISFLY